MKVQRYSLLVEDGLPFFKDDLGNWIKYEDYQNLEARIAALLQHLEKRMEST